MGLTFPLKFHLAEGSYFYAFLNSALTYQVYLLMEAAGDNYPAKYKK